jgi:hypothetical protein
MNSNTNQIEVTMTSQDLYEKFEALEEEVAHCYFRFHERFLSNPPLAKFWVEAALEELQHASILRFCREHQLFGKLDDSRAADRVDQLLDAVRDAAGSPTVTADEAFSAALLVESSELDEAYQALTRPLVQAHLILYEAIRANIRLHHYNFAEAAAQFCRDKAFAEAFKGLAKTEQRRFAERGTLNEMHGTP